jgi:hypothetical protein
MKKRLSLASLGLLAVVVAGCTRNPVSPSPNDRAAVALSERLETANMIFHYTPGDFVDVNRAEAYHTWAVAFLNVTCPKKVDYYKLKDRAQQWEVDEATTTGYAVLSTYEVWTYLPFMNHEQFHLYSLLIGRPTTFFVEGIAVAYQVDPLVNDFEAREKSGEPVHEVARRYRRTGRLLPFSSIVEGQGWAAADYTVAYVEAGSFVRYMADLHGIEKMKDVFRTVKSADTYAVASSKIQTIYGISLGEAETRWLAFLGQ